MANQVQYKVERNKDQISIEFREGDGRYADFTASVQHFAEFYQALGAAIEEALMWQKQNLTTDVALLRQAQHPTKE
jgi:hypothetical protein